MLGHAVPVEVDVQARVGQVQAAHGAPAVQVHRLNALLCGAGHAGPGITVKRGQVERACSGVEQTWPTDEDGAGGVAQAPRTQVRHHHVWRQRLLVPPRGAGAAAGGSLDHLHRWRGRQAGGRGQKERAMSGAAAGEH